MATVLPITSRQSGELSRLLEERGIGSGIYQLLIQDPNRLVEIIFGEYVWWFPPEARLALQFAGYEIVQVPGILEEPVTLNQLDLRAADFRSKIWSSWHGDFTREDIEYFPLPAGEIAWMPKDSLIPGSTEKNFAEQEEVVAEFSQETQKRFGDGVEAIFPTAEHAVLVRFDRRRRMGEYVLRNHYTRTVNCFGSDRLVVGLAGDEVYVGSWPPERRYWDLGVLRLVVPAWIDK